MKKNFMMIVILSILVQGPSYAMGMSSKRLRMDVSTSARALSAQAELEVVKNILGRVPRAVQNKIFSFLQQWHPKYIFSLQKDPITKITPVFKFQFSADGSKLLAFNSSRLQILDTNTGKPILLLQDHLQYHDAQMSPDFSTLITTGFDKKIKICNLPHGKTNEISRPLTPYEIQFNHDSTQFAVSDLVGGNLALYETSTGKHIRTIHAYDDGSDVESMQFNLDGTLLVTTQGDNAGTHVDDNNLFNTAKVWDVQTGAQVHVLQHDLGVNCSQFSRRNPELLLTTAMDGSTKLWNAKTGGCSATITTQKSVQSAHFNNSETAILIITPDELVVWDVTNKKRLWSVSGEYFHQAFWASSGKEIITLSNPGIIKIRDAQTGKCSVTFKADPEKVMKMALSPDSTMIATSGKEIRFWTKQMSGIAHYIQNCCRASDWLTKTKPILDRTRRQEAEQFASNCLAGSSSSSSFAAAGDPESMIWSPFVEETEEELKGRDAVYRSAQEYARANLEKENSVGCAALAALARTRAPSSSSSSSSSASYPSLSSSSCSSASSSSSALKSFADDTSLLAFDAREEERTALSTMPIQ